MQYFVLRKSSEARWKARWCQSASRRRARFRVVRSDTFGCLRRASEIFCLSSVVFQSWLTFVQLGCFFLSVVAFISFSAVRLVGCKREGFSIRTSSRMPGVVHASSSRRSSRALLGAAGRVHVPQQPADGNSELHEGQSCTHEHPNDHGAFLLDNRREC